MERTVISVFGSSLVNPDSRAYQDALELGGEIARAGWTVCNGGYGGTMQAAARGALEAGGHTIGVTCAIFQRGGPNPYIRQEVPTFNLLARLDILMRLAHGYVVLPGGSGTLVELALAIELLGKRMLEPSAPIVLLGDCWRPVVEVLQIEQPGLAPVTFALDARSAVEALRRGLARGRRNPPDPSENRLPASH
jgi:hypothetical protein